MKAIVVLNVTAGSVCDCEGAIDIEGGEDIFTKKRTAEVSYLVFSKKDTLRVRDEWKIPGTKDAMQRILYSDVCIGELNTRMEEEKLLVEGQANVFRYLSWAREKILPLIILKTHCQLRGILTPWLQCGHGRTGDAPFTAEI